MFGCTCSATWWAPAAQRSLIRTSHWGSNSFSIYWLMEQCMQNIIKSSFAKQLFTRRINTQTFIQEQRLRMGKKVQMYKLLQCHIMQNATAPSAIRQNLWWTLWQAWDSEIKSTNVHPPPPPFPPVWPLCRHSHAQSHAQEPNSSRSAASGTSST